MKDLKLAGEVFPLGQNKLDGYFTISYCNCKKQILKKITTSYVYQYHSAAFRGNTLFLDHDNNPCYMMINKPVGGMVYSMGTQSTDDGKFTVSTTDSANNYQLKKNINNRVLLYSGKLDAGKIIFTDNKGEPAFIMYEDDEFMLSKPLNVSEVYSDQLYTNSLITDNIIMKNTHKGATTQLSSKRNPVRNCGNNEYMCGIDTKYNSGISVGGVSIKCCKFDHSTQDEK